MQLLPFLGHLNTNVYTNEMAHLIKSNLKHTNITFLVQTDLYTH